jgi:hypothetical protein
MAHSLIMYVNLLYNILDVGVGAVLEWLLHCLFAEPGAQASIASIISPPSDALTRRPLFSIEHSEI